MKQIVIVFWLFFINISYVLSAQTSEEFILTSKMLDLEYKLPEVNDENKAHERYVVLYRDDYWQVRKSVPDNYISVLKHSTEGDYVDISIPHKYRQEFYLFNIETFEKDLFLIGYNNITSGVDFIRVDQSGFLTVIQEDVPVANLDDKVYVNYDKEQISICAVNNCFSIYYEGGYNKWENEIDKNDLEIVETVFINKNEIATILRSKQFNMSPYENKTEEKPAVFHMAIMSSEKIKFKTAHDVNSGIPYGLELYKGNVLYRVANSASGYRDLLSFDFQRMNLNGLIDLGTNNLEGRVAWSQAYYLNALMALMSGVTDEKLLFNGIQERLKVEIDLLNHVCMSEYPYFLTKRYSMEREPLLYALHLGRIAIVLVKALKLDFIINENCINKITMDLYNLNNTVEKKILNNDGDLIDLEARYGQPVWFDGVNVPYNFLSGYVDGVLHLGDAPKYNKSLNGLLYNEFYLKKELPIVWNYWGGLGGAGWAREGVSLNTAEYQGNNTEAHIGYRTIDASALIALYERDKNGEVSELLIEHLKSLTVNGALLPEINDTWFFYTNEKIKLENTNSKVIRFSRSATHHELYSQVFVLDALIK